MKKEPPTAFELFKQRFEDSRDTLFLTGSTDKRYTYSSYWANAIALADKWRAAGARPGDVIAFALPNDEAVPCAFLSCALGGLVACPIVENLHPEIVDHITTTVRPRFIVDELPQLDPDLSFAGQFEINRDRNEPFIIMFTSGSTGMPKAICHSLENVIGSAASFAALTGMSPSTCLYHVLPMSYMAGFLNAMLAPLMAGAHVIEGPLFSPETAINFWSRPVDREVNTLLLTPTIASALTRLTRSTDLVGSVGEMLDQVQCTSAPIPPNVRVGFREKFGVPLQDCYGITELGGPLTFQDVQDAVQDNYLTVPMPELEINIRETEEGSELWIKSPFRMLGYLEDDELVTPFDDDGFMATGDLAESKNHKIGITGRKKDIIIRGGVNVSPLRIESVISMMPGVQEVAVLGRQHEFWGEQIVAFVVPSGNEEDLKTRIQVLCRDRLGAAERPDTIQIVDSLPRSFVNKILKNELRKLLADE